MKQPSLFKLLLIAIGLAITAHISSATVLNEGITPELILIGDAGNTADMTGYGAVSEPF